MRTGDLIELIILTSPSKLSFNFHQKQVVQMSDGGQVAFGNHSLSLSNFYQHIMGNSLDILCCSDALSGCPLLSVIWYELNIDVLLQTCYRKCQDEGIFIMEWHLK